MVCGVCRQHQEERASGPAKEVAVITKIMANTGVACKSKNGCFFVVQLAKRGNICQVCEKVQYVVVRRQLF